VLSTIHKLVCQNKSKVLFCTLFFCNTLSGSSIEKKISNYTQKWGALKYTIASSSKIDWDSLFVDNVRSLLKNVDIDVDSLLFEKVRHHKNRKHEVEAILSCSSIYQPTQSIHPQSARYWYKKDLPNRYSKNDKHFDPKGFLISEELALLGVAKAWTVINYFYYYKNDLRGDWNNLLLVYISDVLNASKASNALPAFNLKYRLVIKRMLADLNDCHSSVSSDNYLDYHGVGSFKPAIEVKITETKHIILSYVDTNRYLNRFRVGDTVEIINGVDAKNLIDSLRGFCACRYNNGIHRELSKWIIRGKKDDSSVYQIKGKIYALKNLVYFYERQEALYQSSFINDSVIYLNMKDINSIRDFQKFFNKIKRKYYLIIDLRNGSNGIDYLVNYLLNENKRFINFYYPNFKEAAGFNEETMTINQVFPKRILSHKIPFEKAIVLVNENTQSHSEFIVMALQTSPKVIVVGDTSAAAVAMIRKLYLPGNILFAFTAVGFSYPNQNKTNGRVYLKLNNKFTGYDYQKTIEYCLKLLYK
jgi:hypothetical protein